MTEEKQPVPWRYGVCGVLILLGLLGPFGLFFLWKSPSFNAVAKWCLTVVILVLTALLIVTAELLPLFIAQQIAF